jgi:DUF1009 family protein
MPSDAAPVVGILAGSGSLPREIAASLAARGRRVHIVALAGEADRSFGPFAVTEVGWGQIGGMLDALKGAGCGELVIVGGVRRPDLARLRPDLGFFRSLPAIAQIIRAGGDDSVLSRVVRFFEHHGMRVISPAAAAPELVVGEGTLGCVLPGPAHAEDVAAGFDVIGRLAPFDVGQAVVVAAGRIAAIEGAEGTDAMLERLAPERARGSGGSDSAGVLVKRRKPGQEMRVDLPTIGPDTISRVRRAGLAGIVVEARGALAAERAELIARADAAGVFVAGIAAPEPALAGSAASAWHFEWIGRFMGPDRLRDDALKGAGVLSSIGDLADSCAVAVDRGHVLAVETGEGIGALIERGAALRQWGIKRFKRRAGVAVLRDVQNFRSGLARAAALKYAGVAVIGSEDAAIRAAGKEFMREADRLGVHVAVLQAEASER